MLKAYGMKDVGRLRSVNQDYVCACTVPIGNLPNLFIVADGMGGHRAGDLASEYTVSMVKEAVIKSMQKNPFQILKSAVSFANQKLIEKARESVDYSGMGTTLVAATVVDNIVYIVNVGDSRLYKVGDTIEQITEDHSLVEEMVRLGKIPKESARNHPDKNIITRAIGISETVEPDFFDAEFLHGECLLLCSDGLSNMLEDTEIKSVMDQHADVETKAKELVNAANKNGGNDNIAVVIIEQG